MTLPMFTAAERAALNDRKRVYDRMLRDNGYLQTTREVAEHSALTKLLAWLDQQEATE